MLMEIKYTEIDELFGESSGDEDSSQYHTLNCEPLVSVREAHVGGGRGVFANTDLPPGFLVLSEIPVIAWPKENSNLEDHSNLMTVLNSICADAKALEITKHLHPVTLQSVSDIEIDAAREILTLEILEIIMQEIKLEENEILRVFLTLQHNGFVSGLYKYLSLVNHSCNPNCIKMAPKASSLNASEIWTTRQVMAGEELTICYCYPLETSRQSMRAFLKSHHYFDCVCDRCHEIVSDGSPCSLDETKNNLLLENSISRFINSIQPTIETLEMDLKWCQEVDPMRQLKHCICLMRELDRVLHQFGINISNCVAELPNHSNFVELLSQSLSLNQISARANKLGVAICVKSIQILQTIEQKEMQDKTLSKRFPFGQRNHIKFDVCDPLETAVTDSHESSSSSQSLIEQSLIHFFTQKYALFSITIICCQLKYLNQDHPDVGVAFLELSSALSISLSVYKQEFEFHYFVESIYPLLNKLKSMFCVISNVLADIEKLYATSFNTKDWKDLIRDFSLQLELQGRRLQNMYAVHLRYPESIQMHRESRNKRVAGTLYDDSLIQNCYWGCKFIK